MDTLKNIALCIVAGFVLNLISVLIDSDFLSSFVSDRIILILVSLLAINTTTTSVLMTKLREISEEHDIDFSTSISQLRLAMREQFGLIVVAFILSVVGSSGLLQERILHFGFALDVLLTACFLFAIYILYDLANSIFVILKAEEKVDQ